MTGISDTCIIKRIGRQGEYLDRICFHTVEAFLKDSRKPAGGDPAGFYFLEIMLRRLTASAMCSAVMAGFPARSAMVRATLMMRS